MRVIKSFRLHPEVVRVIEDIAKGFAADGKKSEGFVIETMAYEFARDKFPVDFAPGKPSDHQQ
jgi:hypothetical protein